MSNRSFELVQKQVLNLINKMFDVHYGSSELDFTFISIPGFDSFKKVELLLELESIFAVEFTADQIDGFVDIRDVVKFLSR